ncbi:MAG: hypothetical protein NUV74_05510 [Candidatus Brocadiaceae bacterium]|nr:hypothetical protein [Candidatus Brocadiaceae bacterium]
MQSRFGCEVKVLGDVDAEGYVKALRMEDNSEREYHLGDLRTDTKEDEQWMQAACHRTLELRYK